MSFERGLLEKNAFFIVAKLAVLDTISEKVKTDTILAFLPLLSNRYYESVSNHCSEKIVKIVSLITTPVLKEQVINRILSFSAESENKVAGSFLLRDLANSSTIIPDALREKVLRMIDRNCNRLTDRKTKLAIEKLKSSVAADSQGEHGARLNSSSPAQGSAIGTKNLFENLKSARPSR